MRVLLDECLPRALGHELVGHDVTTVPEAGWAGKLNGELLELADGQFDALVTIDQRVRFQQNLAGRQLAVVAFRAQSNRLADLVPLVPEALRALAGLGTGQFVPVPADRT